MDAMQCKCYLFVILCGECFVLVYLKEMDVFVVGAIIWDHHLLPKSRLCRFRSVLLASMLILDRSKLKSLD